MDSLDAQIQMLVRLAGAVLLGGLIGYERERSGKPAGFRTHIMVSLGSALFALVSIFGFGGVGDPGRVASQIVTGIGFLGAGAILHRRGSIYGLTTAATLWVTAAVGLAAGVGLLLVATVATLVAYVALRFGTHLEPGHPRGRTHKSPAQKDESRPPKS